jgi:hypothetical protein
MAHNDNAWHSGFCVIEPTAEATLNALCRADDMNESRLMTQRLAIVGVVLCGCAHPPPSQPAAPTAPAAVTVAESENDHAPDSGPVAVYRVCVGTDGNLQSLEALRTVPGHEKELEERLRAMPFRPQPVPTCVAMRVVLEGPRTPAVAAATSDDGSPAAPVATTKFKNVPAHAFDAELAERPMPHLPDEVKLEHINQELVFLAKVCAGSDGRISTISIIQGIPGANEAIIGTLRQWRLRSPLPGVGICTLQKFVFTVNSRFR